MEIAKSGVGAVIAEAQSAFAQLLQSALRESAISRDQYVRYLSMQYHLTKGVQRYFLAAAAHESLTRRKALRKFLVDFANEEENHYLIAAHDLAELGAEPLAEPFDVMLWHVYFRSVVAEHPFIRLGAACVLENISGGPARAVVKAALRAPFLTAANSRFLTIHQHEAIPHGDEVVAALDAADLDESMIHDLEQGARRATVLYLRMAQWALDPGSLATYADGGRFPSVA